MGGPSKDRRGRLIAFEGVDGAGKTTVLARVAEKLRARGETVFLPRSGKEHDSRPTRMIRRLTRDRRNIDLTPRAELLLYCAREAQVLQELVRPALARGETVLVDRSLLTPMVLGMARGLSAQECQAAAHMAAGGTQPDLTLVFDVHPRTSRLRKRLEKIRAHTLAVEGGRKGLAGSAFKERVRNLYTEIAAEAGYPVFHVERATPDELEARVCRVLEHGPEVDIGETAADREPQWQLAADATLPEGLTGIPLRPALLFSRGLVAGRGLRASALASESALTAWALDAEDPSRVALLATEPYYALRGLRRCPLSGDDDVRLRALERTPAAALDALRYQPAEVVDRLLTRYADEAGDAVLGCLAAREDDFARALRKRLWPKASDAARSNSLSGCDGDEAWGLRRELLEDHPSVGLSTLRGLTGPEVDRWLERYADMAPKPVIGALSGRTDEVAYRLRDHLFDTGREVIDTVRGLDDPQAWALRERALTRWPSTVMHSLVGLADDGKVREWTERCRELAAGDLHMLRHLQALEEWSARPLWAQGRLAQDDLGGDD